MKDEEVVRVCLFVDVVCASLSVLLTIMFYLLGKPVFAIIMLIPVCVSTLSLRKVLQFARRKKIRLL